MCTVDKHGEARDSEVGKGHSEGGWKQETGQERGNRYNPYFKSYTVVRFSQKNKYSFCWECNTHPWAQHLDKIYFLWILELENVSSNLLWGRLGNQEKSFYGPISACSTNNEFLRVLINKNSSLNSLFGFSKTLWLSVVSKPSTSRGILFSQRCSGSEAHTLAQKWDNEKFQAILGPTHWQPYSSLLRGARDWVGEGGEKEVSSPYF